MVSTQILVALTSLCVREIFAFWKFIFVVGWWWLVHYNNQFLANIFYLKTFITNYEQKLISNLITDTSIVELLLYSESETLFGVHVSHESEHCSLTVWPNSGCQHRGLNGGHPGAESKLMKMNSFSYLIRFTKLFTLNCFHIRHSFHDLILNKWNWFKTSSFYDELFRF